MGKLADTLSQMSDDFLQSVIRQTRVDKLDATGKLASSYRIEKVENGFVLVNDAKYSKAVLVTGSKPARKGGGGDKLANLEEWAKAKGLSPFRKLKGGFKFAKINTPKRSAWRGMIFMLNKAISEKGTIKRFGYKGSDTLKQVVDTKIKKWAVDISKAFKDDLLTQMKAEISFKDLKI